MGCLSTRRIPTPFINDFNTNKSISLSPHTTFFPLKNRITSTLIKANPKSHYRDLHVEHFEKYSKLGVLIYEII